MARILVSRESCSRFFHLVVGVDREKRSLHPSHVTFVHATDGVHTIHTYIYI
jgi:hypothetical protein